jgi:mannitol/fructose-specific phosphotransferase system IIA component (Ntr-type)
MNLSDHLSPSRVLIAPPVAGREELFRLFAEVFFEAGVVSSPKVVSSRLLDRESILSTGIGSGVAIPHAQINGLGRLAMAASVHPESLDYPALDDEPVRLVFCLLGDTNTSADHLAGLARLARLARRVHALDELIASRSPEEFVEALRRIEGV